MSAAAPLEVEYRVATRDDEPRLHALLAQISTEGHIRLSFRREPDAFAHPGSWSQGWIVARDLETGADVGLCERVVRRAFVNGVAQDLPYLAGLRVVPEYRHRLRVLRGGFEAVRDRLVQPGEPAFALTSIMSDNAPARRLLGANLRGMPRYEPVGEFSTFALFSRSRTTAAATATAADLPALSGLLLRSQARWQFAHAWDLPALEYCIATGSLKPQDFRVIRRDGGIAACAALWDLSRQRQLVIAGYSRALTLARPAVNLVARLTGSPVLPPPGAPLRAAYLSHVAAGDPRDLAELVRGIRDDAHRRGIGIVLAGSGSYSPHAAVLRALAPRREYRSTLYLVRWPAEAAPPLDPAAPLGPELALL